MNAPPHPLFHFGMAGAFRTRHAPAVQLKSGPLVTDDAWPPRFTKIRLWLDDGGELVMTDARRFGGFYFETIHYISRQSPISDLIPFWRYRASRCSDKVSLHAPCRSKHCFWTSVFAQVSAIGWRTKSSIRHGLTRAGAATLSVRPKSLSFG